MVEEKKKRGRPKKNAIIKPVLSDIAKAPDVDRSDQKWRRDDLCVQMIMGIINKQGSIKYDFAKDIFDTATQLAYDFGWMTRPKPDKKQKEEVNPVFDPAYGVTVEEKPQEALANTPADIFRMLREG